MVWVEGMCDEEGCEREKKRDGDGGLVYWEMREEERLDRLVVVWLWRRIEGWSGNDGDGCD